MKSIFMYINLNVSKKYRCVSNFSFFTSLPARRRFFVPSVRKARPSITLSLLAMTRIKQSQCLPMLPIINQSGVPSRFALAYPSLFLCNTNVFTQGMQQNRIFLRCCTIRECAAEPHFVLRPLCLFPDLFFFFHSHVRQCDDSEAVIRRAPCGDIGALIH